MTLHYIIHYITLHYRTLIIFQNKKKQNMGGGIKDMLSPHVKTWGDISPPSPQDLRPWLNCHVF